MSLLDPALLAERTAQLERHLERVRSRLPARAEDLLPESDVCDAVILHLWQAVQIAIDLGVSACVKLGLGAPPTYAEAFRRLAEHEVIDVELAQRLALRWLPEPRSACIRPARPATRLRCRA